MQCTFDECGQTVPLSEIISHMQRSHNKTRGDEIKCVVHGCDRSYTTLKSFAAHIQKQHYLPVCTGSDIASFTGGNLKEVLLCLKLTAYLFNFRSGPAAIIKQNISKS